MKQKISRRDFMRGAAVVAASGLLAGCTESDASTSNPSSSSSSSSSGSASSSGSTSSSSSSASSDSSEVDKRKIIWLFESLNDGSVEITGYSHSSDALKPAGHVVIPRELAGRSVKQIGFSALSKCTDITAVTLPDTIEIIGEFAFDGCTKLASINWPYKLQKIDTCAFRGTALNELSIPANIKMLNGSVFTQTKVKKIRFGGEPIFAGGEFSDCKYLTDVKLPKNVYLARSVYTEYTLAISPRFFKNCTALDHIAIPESTQAIYAEAFSGCTKLREVIMPQNLKKIEKDAFRRCTSLTKMTVPDGVEYIHQTAFCECSGMKKIYIPKTVTHIYRSAFGMCTSLSDVYYGGTKEEWMRIVISDGNSGLSLATIHYGASRQDAE